MSGGKRSGYVVKLKDGRKGYHYPGEGMYAGKARVYIIDSAHKKTGENVLCDPNSLQIIGFLD